VASTRLRTFLKGLSWELFSNSICMLLAVLMFGGIGSCLLFTLIAVGIKLGLFYLHDRAWHRISWGKE
jgi:adenylylsulfate kinase